MDIKLEGYDRLQQAFMQAPAMVEHDLRAWMERTAAHLTDEITAITPKKTGNLQQSIVPYIVPAGNLGVGAIIATPLNYADPVEFGSKPHDIVPKGKGALHFIFNGIPINVKKVHHPGTKGHFMFKRAFDANKDQIQASFNNMIDHVLFKISTGVA